MAEDLKFQQAVELAREGNKEEARALLQELVDENPEDAKAWLLMARLVDDDDEKRICLANVLQLEPTNEAAQKMLEKLEEKAAKLKDQSEFAPGIPRRLLTTVIIACGLFAFVVCLLVILISSGINSSRAAATAQAALFVTNAFETEIALTQNVFNTSTAIVAITQTAAATITPTATVTRTPDLPPTFTPTPTQEGSAVIPPLDPPPPLAGKLVVWGGRDFFGNGFYEPFLITLSSGTYQEGDLLNADSIANPDIHPTGQRVVYQRYDASFNGWVLYAVNIDGQQGEDLGLRWANRIALTNPQQPRFSADGTQVIFIGTAIDNQTNEVFLLNLGTSQTQRITTDSANYAYPSFSPDGRRVLVVKQDPSAGTDLVTIDLAEGFAQTPVTGDGNFTIETVSDFSADGLSVVYAAHSQTTPNNSNIYIRLADGRGVAQVVRETDADEITPLFSPDGGYIAYASNRTGNYDIYIVRLSDGVFFQLTTTEQDEFLGGWSAN